MRILVRYLGNWGLGDLLCSDPLVGGLVERFGPDTEVFLEGRVGNVIHNPIVRGMAPPELAPDHVVEVRLFTHMDLEAYGRLEAGDSLIDHMCSYGDVRPTDRRPRLHLGLDERTTVHRLGIEQLPGPRVAICADHLDPLRHWPVERWHAVASGLAAAGASIVEVGSTHRLGIGTDLVGNLSVRETAAVIEACDLYLGNNSGLFHYAQAARTPCVILFSLATPRRFFHPGAEVHAIQADHLPCIDCMTRRFAAMQTQGCITAPRGRCMIEIPEKEVRDTAFAVLEKSLAIA